MEKNEDKKTTMISIKERLEIIRRTEEGASETDLVEEYDVSRYIIRDILKKKRKLEEYADRTDNDEGMIGKKIMKLSKYEDLDKAMVLWYHRQRRKGVIIPTAVCKAKAKYFYDTLKLQGDFNASGGWLTGFKRRHGIHQMAPHGIKLPDRDPTAQGFKTEFQNLVESEELSREQIYSVKEFGLYWKRLPIQTQPKFHNQRLTVLCCDNAAGSHVLKAVVVGSAGASAVSSGSSDVTAPDFPIVYRYDRSGFMNREIFSRWLRTVFVPSVRRHLSSLGLPMRAVLLMENAHSHPTEDIVKLDDCIVLLKYLPTSLLPTIQPMEGVARQLKTVYRKNLLTILVTEYSKSILTFLRKFTMLDAINEISAAWDSIENATVRHSWQQILSKRGEEFAETQRDLFPEILQDLRQIEGCGDADEEELRSWLRSDEHLNGHEVLSDEDILRRVMTDEDESDENGEEKEDEKEEELISLKKVPHRDAFNYTQSLLHYLEQQEDSSLADIRVLRRIQDSISQKIS